MGRRSVRIAVALGACAFSTAASVVGGACTLNSGSTAPAPMLQTGPYVLTASNTTPPPLTITDSTGRRIRVIADTITFAPSATSYHTSGVAAITPVGGTEQPPTSIVVAQRPYTQNGAIITLPTTIGGPATATIQGSSGVQLQMSNGSIWIYLFR